ncbi:MAG: hypothetical protein E7411_03295 [Ruminococcaceae bacterium]|nr:hypothetical protein [Oscillospiraceae bacterium]
MKKIISFVLISALLIAFAGCGRVEPTVFTFEGTEVSMKEFNIFYMQQIAAAEQSLGEEAAKEYWETEAEDGKTNLDVLKETAYNELLNLYVTAKMAEKSGFTYDSEVLQFASSIKNQMTGGSTETFLNLCKTDSVSLDRVARMIAIREKMNQLLISDGVIDLSEPSLKNHFENKYFKAHHILFTTVDSATNEPLSEEEIASKKAKAEEALKKVKAGTNFITYANEVSEDPGKEQSPEGYVFGEGEMVKEFEDTVKGLEINGISDIVETSYGYHIIKRLPLSYEKDVEAVGGADAFYQTAASDFITDYINANVGEWKKEFNIVENKAVVDALKL